jgi:hypothetical protein
MPVMQTSTAVLQPLAACHSNSAIAAQLLPATGRTASFAGQCCHWHGGQPPHGTLATSMPVLPEFTTFARFGEVGGKEPVGCVTCVATKCGGRGGTVRLPSCWVHKK